VIKNFFSLAGKIINMVIIEPAIAVTESILELITGRL